MTQNLEPQAKPAASPSPARRMAFTLEFGEHHLFPTVCHVHYPAITQIVEQTCRDHGVPYAEHPSFLSGLAEHYRWLRRMGQPDAEA